MSVKSKPGTAAQRDGSKRSDTPLADELLTVAFCCHFSVTVDRIAVVEPCGCPRNGELRVLGVGGLPEIAAGDDLAALIAGRHLAGRSRHRRGDVKGRVQGRRRGRRARRRRAVAVRRRLRRAMGQGPAPRRGRPPPGAADRADERTTADHRDAPRLRVRQQWRRRVVERGGRARRRAPGRPGRLGAPLAPSASPSSESTSP